MGEDILGARKAFRQWDLEKIKLAILKNPLSEGFSGGPLFKRG